MHNAASSTAWHAMTPAMAVESLHSSMEGISRTEAQQRLCTFGPNALPPLPKPSALRRFVRQFNSVLIYILLVAGVITALLGHFVDSGVIIGVVLINSIIGYIQEGQAEDALTAIRQMLSLNATVMRDGQNFEITAEKLVPGDIVFISSGDKVPADLRLLEVHGLRLNEAALTGESMPIEKQIALVAAESELGDRICMAYSGTLVTQGRGIGIVVATSCTTEIGRISTVLTHIEESPTPLLQKMAQFAQLLTWSIVILSCLLFAFGILVRGYSSREMFLAVVGLAVAAIPEGLPAIVTITLAIGVKRMARKNAIIRRLPAVEALGSVTVICTDKTGTLTKNEMTVQQVITADARFDVQGSGYAPHGGFLHDGITADPGNFPLLVEISRASLLCNDASLRLEGDAWVATGDPTEAALVSMALKAGLAQDFEREALPQDDAIPFEAEHRFMATLHHDHAGKSYIFLKGAPERIFDLCATQRHVNADRPFQASHWYEALEVAAGTGVRLLAIAMRLEPVCRQELLFSDVERGGFTLLAVLGLADPPREEAIHALAACRSAGIRVKMITGDHPVTAAAIGRQLALAETVQAVRGNSLDEMDEAELEEIAESCAVFARASPEHKLKLVTALQTCGEVVAMTGDGVNDAPALKRADVGVAMGERGTEAAKDAAEVVLADDNFASIVAAVQEGRTVYENIRKAIIFTLPTNGGEAGMVLVSIMLGMTLPITPVQILWVNMITEVTLSMAIAFEKPEPDIMNRPPRDPREPLLSRLLVWRITLVSCLLVAGSMGLFLWELDQGASLEAARTIAVNALVIGEITYLFNCRHIKGSGVSWEGATGNRYILGAVGILLLFQMLFTYAPFMQEMFGTAAISGAAWVRIVLFGLSLSLIVEGEKLLLRTGFLTKATSPTTPDVSK